MPYRQFPGGLAVKDLGLPLLWLGSLAQELPKVAGVAKKKKKKKKKKPKGRTKEVRNTESWVAYVAWFSGILSCHQGNRGFSCAATWL